MVIADFCGFASTWLLLDIVEESELGSKLIFITTLGSHSLFGGSHECYKPEILISFLCCCFFGDMTSVTFPTRTSHWEFEIEPCAHLWLAISTELQNVAEVGIVSWGLLTRPDWVTNLTANSVKIILCKGFANRKSFLDYSFGVLCFFLFPQHLQRDAGLPHSIICIGEGLVSPFPASVVGNNAGLCGQPPPQEERGAKLSYGSHSDSALSRRCWGLGGADNTDLQVYLRRFRLIQCGKR